MFENLTEPRDVANDYVICCRPVPSNVRSAVKPSCAPSTFIATYERFTSKYANILASYVAKRLAVPVISSSTRWHIRRFSLLVEWTLTHFNPSEGMWKYRRIYSTQHRLCIRIELWGIFNFLVSWKSWPLRDFLHLLLGFLQYHVNQMDGSVQDCSNSIANALELLQSCTKPLGICYCRIP